VQVQAAGWEISGEGETGLMVYKMLLRYWDWTPEEDVQATHIPYV
jgi:hypothetical protein